MNQEELNKIMQEALSLGMGKIEKQVEKDYTILTLAAALNSHIYAHNSSINMCQQLIDVLIESNQFLSTKLKHVTGDFDNETLMSNLRDLETSMRNSIKESKNLIEHTENSPLVKKQLTDVRDEINLDKINDLFKK
jgi:hypothetical protein